MADQDLITYARDAASRGDDLFKLLDVDATSSESDIRRAFRRKALTAHPDKAGASYDPALYERLEKGRDVLTSAAAREAYDNGMRAILQKKQRLDQMSTRRRRLREELEERENAAKKQKTEGQGQGEVQNPELEAMAARGRAKMEERKRLIREAEERERLSRERDDDEREADIERRLREIQQRKAEKQQRKEKKAKKGGEASQTRWSPGREIPSSHDHPPSSTTTATTESKADAYTSTSRPSVESTKPTPQAQDEAQGEAQPPAGTTSNGPSPASTGGGFAAVMARLKAAQAKKEEAKRRAPQEAGA